MATVEKYLDIRRKRKDDTYPLVLRIVHNRQTRDINLGYHFLEKDWDESKRRVKKSCKRYSNIQRLNNLFDVKLTEARAIITRLEEKEELALLTANDLKTIIAGKERNKTVFEFTEYLIKQLKGVQKLGNAAVYEECLNLLKEFRDGKDLSFEQLNYSFLKKLESYYLARNNKINSLSVRMRTIRAIFNKAIKEKLVEEKYYPFKDYKIENQKTKKRAIKKDDVEKIKSANNISVLEFLDTKNYFMLSFYLRGMSFSDMAKLKVGDIEDDRISYFRSKTKSEFSIKVTPQMKAIFDDYIEEKSKDDYILPIIKRKEPELIRKDIKNALKVYNKQLKELGKALGIEKKLTSYVTRHSWASIALKMGIPIEVISEGLGHEEIRTTQIYLEGLDSQTLDDANDLITG
jgi:integrase/recombinase XerD